MPGSSGWPPRRRSRTPPGCGDRDSRRDYTDTYRPDTDLRDRHDRTRDDSSSSRCRRDDDYHASCRYSKDFSSEYRSSSSQRGRGGSTSRAGSRPESRAGSRPDSRPESRTGSRPGSSHSHYSHPTGSHSAPASESGRDGESRKKKKKNKNKNKGQGAGEATTSTSPDTFPQSASAPALKRKYSSHDGPSESAGLSSMPEPSKSFRSSSSSNMMPSSRSAPVISSRTRDAPPPPSRSESSFRPAVTTGPKSGPMLGTYSGSSGGGSSAGFQGGKSDSRGEGSSRGGHGPTRSVNGRGGPPTGPAAGRGGFSDRGRGGLGGPRGGRGGGGRGGGRFGSAPNVSGLPPTLIADRRPVEPASTTSTTVERKFVYAPPEPEEEYRKYIPGERLVFSFHPNLIENLPPDIEHRASLAAAKEKRERAAMEEEEANERAAVQRQREKDEEARRKREEKEEERKKEEEEKMTKAKAAEHEAAKQAAAAKAAADKLAADRAAEIKAAADRAAAAQAASDKAWAAKKAAEKAAANKAAADKAAADKLAAEKAAATKVAADKARAAKKVAAEKAAADKAAADKAVANKAAAGMSAAEKAAADKEAADDKAYANAVAAYVAAARGAAPNKAAAEQAAWTKRTAVKPVASARIESSDEEIEIIETPASHARTPAKDNTNVNTTTKNDRDRTKEIAKPKDKDLNGNIQTTTTDKSITNGKGRIERGIINTNDGAKTSSGSAKPTAASSSSTTTAQASTNRPSTSSGGNGISTLPTSASAPLALAQGQATKSTTSMAVSRSAPVIGKGPIHLLPLSEIIPRPERDPDEPIPADRRQKAMKRFWPAKPPMQTPSGSTAAAPAPVSTSIGFGGTATTSAATSTNTRLEPASPSSSKLGLTLASRSGTGPTSPNKAAICNAHQKAQQMTDDALQHAMKRAEMGKKESALLWEEREKRRKAAAEEVAERQVQAMNDRFNARHRMEQLNLLNQGSGLGSSARPLKYAENETPYDGVRPDPSRPKRSRPPGRETTQARKQVQWEAALEEEEVNKGSTHISSAPQQPHQPSQRPAGPPASVNARIVDPKSVPPQISGSAMQPVAIQRIDPPSSPDFATPQTPLDHMIGLPSVGTSPSDQASEPSAERGNISDLSDKSPLDVLSPGVKSASSMAVETSRGLPAQDSPVDVKPSLAELEGEDAARPEGSAQANQHQPPADEGVLWFKRRELPAKCYNLAQAEVQRSARNAWTRSRLVHLRLEGKRATKVLWTTDGMGLDWVRKGSSADAAHQAHALANRASASVSPTVSRTEATRQLPGFGASAGGESTGEDEDEVDELDSSDDEGTELSLAAEQARRQADMKAQSERARIGIAVAQSVAPTDGAIAKATPAATVLPATDLGQVRPHTKSDISTGTSPEHRPNPTPVGKNLEAGGQASASAPLAAEAGVELPHAEGRVEPPHAPAELEPPDADLDSHSDRAKRLAELTADVERAKDNLARHFLNQRNGIYHSREIGDGLTQDLFDAADALAKATTRKDT